ncbi:hypothetical protein BC834DRAFT_603953 [Gloeopeniophorella convolvens]|nr:hypothetical protein BC834DRAFT_603953 [Gloeopeniophorella convolvens]
MKPSVPRFTPLCGFVLILLMVPRRTRALSISAPECSLPGWEWTYNSMGQSPCVVSAYLQATCNGDFIMPPISGGAQYWGPDNRLDDPCRCNTVVYSLVSACEVCQGSQWVDWENWHNNCTVVEPATQFPNSVPPETRVPHWAYLNVTVTSHGILAITGSPLTQLHRTAAAGT